MSLITQRQGARALGGVGFVTVVFASWMVFGWGGQYLPVLLAGAVGVAQSLQTMPAGPVLPIALLLTVALLVRQSMVVRQNGRLLRVVADRVLRDPLTGLANRASFVDHLDAAMTRLRQRDDGAVAVLALDVDDFQLVNDNLGHPTGDALLRSVGERLLGCVFSGDTVARIGGDEFAVLVEGTSGRVHVIAQQVAEAFGDPFALDGRRLLVRPSIGLALAAGTPTTLVRTACSSGPIWRCTPRSGRATVACTPSLPTCT